MNLALHDYDKNFQQELAMFFKEKRQENRLSIEYIAKYLGVLSSGYARYENGSRSMPLSIMKKLATFYKLDYYQIFELIDKRATENIKNDYIEIKQINIKNISYNNNELLKRIEKLEREINGIKNNEYFKSVKRK